jgi:hypothetical protein
VPEAAVLPQMVYDKVEALGLQRAEDFFGVGAKVIEGWRRLGKPPLWAIEKVVLDAAGRRDGALPSSNSPVIGANWEGKKIILCLPWYKQVCPFTALSLMAQFERDKMGILMASGDAFISHTRNKLAKAFLETKAEWSLWVDDDMIIPMGKPDWFLQVTGAKLRPEWAGQHTLNRLLSHEKPLVGALYSGRQREGRLMFCEGCNDPLEAARLRREGPRNECKPTRWVATGCLLVHRTVFEALDKKYPHLKQNFFSPSEHDLFEAMDKIKTLIEDQSVDPQQRLLRIAGMLDSARTLSNTNSRVGVGEDVIFCVRAGQAGFQAHIDLGLVCGHVGTEVYGPWNTSPVFQAV